MRRITIAIVGCLGASTALAQVSDAPTVNSSVTITTGATFQQVLPAASSYRRSVTIENNNASDACNLVIGTNQITDGTTTLATSITINGKTMTAGQASITLSPGGSYQRYQPYIPADAIHGTCATTGDSLYIDIQ